MGKGDKKTKRGKIILGTYGVSRRRKKQHKPEIKPVEPVVGIGMKDRKSVKERRVEKEAAEIKEVKEVTERMEVRKKNQAEVLETKEVRLEKESGKVIEAAEVNEIKQQVG